MPLAAGPDARLLDPMSTLELWAAAACTVQRVGDRWFDQVRRTGHHDRADDIERFAALGVQRVRFPVLWPRVMQGDVGSPDWRWHDTRLTRIRELGLSAIVDLVDGSAPFDVADPEFAQRFAAYARAVARRYPWIEDWTPIHGAFTCARRGLLGSDAHPQVRDAGAGLHRVVHAMSATIAAMRAIREVVPHARFVLTENIGRVSSTPALAEHRRFANEARWLAIDLACGRVDREHPLHDQLDRLGAPAALLDAMVEEPCPPDVIGIDYDLGSDRFIDDRVEHYPAHAWTGDGSRAFADVEAVRSGTIAGHRTVLEDVWRRYERPLALTRVHLGGTREAQMRWLFDAWCAAAQAREAGLDVRGVTVSAVFGEVHRAGSIDGDRYEPGAYDVRSREPRATAVAGLARELAAGITPAHPLLASPGFWRARDEGDDACKPRPLLITGTGKLAERFVERCARRGIATARAARLERGFEPAAALPGDPWAVVAIPDGPAPLRRGQTDGVPSLLALARTCEHHSIPLLTVSSDTVFDGAAHRPYVESDPAQPVTVAGRTWRRLERRIQAVAPSALIVRVGPLLDPQDPHDPLARILGALAEGSRVRVPDDEIVSPSLVPELVDAALDLLIDGMQGLWHATNTGAISLFQLARAAAVRAGISTSALEPGASLHPWGAEVGPGMRALASERAATMSAIDVALAAYVATTTPQSRVTTAA